MLDRSRLADGVAKVVIAGVLFAGFGLDFGLTVAAVRRLMVCIRT